MYASNGRVVTHLWKMSARRHFKFYWKVLRTVLPEMEGKPVAQAFRPEDFPRDPDLFFLREPRKPLKSLTPEEMGYNFPPRS